MSQDQSDYEKKIAKANASRQRQLDKQKAKIASPEYQKAQQEKQQAAQEKSQQKAYQKMKGRMADPDYITEQQEKQLETQSKAFEKQRARQQVKEISPVYKTQKAKISSPEKQKEQQEKQQAAQLKSRLKSQQRAVEKLKDRMADSAYIKEQQEKQRETQSKAFEKQRARQQVKEASPEYKVSNPPKPIKSKGTKGRNPTALEKMLGNKIGDIGCICCLNKKWYTTDMQEQETTKFVSLHHVDGRTKEWAHAKVLPLCAFHHDTPAPSHAPEELTPIHRGNKKEWITFNGSEDELLKQVYEMIEEERPWLGS